MKERNKGEIQRRKREVWKKGSKEMRKGMKDEKNKMKKVLLLITNVWTSNPLRHSAILSVASLHINYVCGQWDNADELLERSQLPVESSGVFH